MTNEEVIVCLKIMFSFWANTHELNVSEMEEAKDIAIRALTQSQPDKPLTLEELRGMDRKERRTNADRIRSMTDEELASALVKYEGTETRPTPYGGHEHIFHGPHGEMCGTRAYSVQLWMDWLRQPLEED